MEQAFDIATWFLAGYGLISMFDDISTFWVNR